MPFGSDLNPECDPEAECAVSISGSSTLQDAIGPLAASRALEEQESRSRCVYNTVACTFDEIPWELRGWRM